ncbi:MAG TPA: tRNA (cytosine(32)/uridine(32)-2'-O)-methyltransferase TrmJ [Gammaproteobacteria bacterium]|nr:tRNA (cytosine(32)/uridine(32)-2'-O)-methyltransferase TrmJ [Gammaproteobacteria bacterium]
MLSNIRFVLINTSHPGNIGAVARAMKNMRLEQLYLVDPQKFPSTVATARASGAIGILEKATVCETVSEAIKGCSLVLGTSARLRTIAWPQMDARMSAEKIVAEKKGSQIAILFGREHSGLTNEELELCHYLVHIPCNPDFSSLNIAAAAQVIAYEILMASQNRPTEIEREVIGAEDDWATSGEVERFYSHLESVLIETGFLDPSNPRLLMRKLKRLYQRARLEKNEVNILRGILTAVQRVTKK